MGKAFYPEAVVLAASAAWGLFWLPLRAFDAAGLRGQWAVLAQFSAPLLLILPWALTRVLRGKPSGIGEYRTGILTGSAVSLYLESLLLTEVARSLILFYVMPVWATILEVLVLRRRMSLSRAISLGLGLAGMGLVIFTDSALSVSLNLGDSLALLSGILFSLGALNVRSSREASVSEQLFSFFLWSSLAALVFAFLPVAPRIAPPGARTIASLAPWIFLAAGGFLIPVMTGIYWGSRRVDPGRLGILLQIEALVGIASAAFLAGEPFGLRQVLGSAAVAAAGLMEVLGNRNRPNPASPPSR